MRKFKSVFVFVIAASLWACALGSRQAFNISAFEFTARQRQEICIAPALYEELSEAIGMWKQQRMGVSIFSGLVAGVLICWQRLRRTLCKNRVSAAEATEEPTSYSKLRRRENSEASPRRFHPEADADPLCTPPGTASAGQPLTPPPRGGARMVGFAVLWACVAITVCGFSPAYVVRAMGRPWYTDAVRQIAPNAFQFTTSVHAIASVAWLAVMAHQLATAWVGVPPRSAGTDRSGWTHRAVGYLSVVCVGSSVVSGIFVLRGDVRLRLTDRHAVVGNGMYVLLNYVVGFAAVLQGDVHAHKQGMSWAIAWSTLPGAFRLLVYLGYLYKGVPPLDDPGCERLLVDNVPEFCQYSSFLSTNAGCGVYGFAEYTCLICMAAGVSATAFGSPSKAVVDWGILAGNLIAWLCISIVPDLMLQRPDDHRGTVLWACLGCTTEPWWCMRTCDSDRRLCAG